MLSAAHRLRRRGDFATAIRTGRRAGRGPLVVHLAEPPTEPVPVDRAPGAAVRVGFVIPKAVGGAVVRNLVRRRLRHLVRDRLDRVPAGDLVIRALPGAADRGYAQLAADLDAALAAALARRARPPRGGTPR